MSPCLRAGLSDGLYGLGLIQVGLGIIYIQLLIKLFVLIKGRRLPFYIGQNKNLLLKIRGSRMQMSESGMSYVLSRRCSIIFVVLESVYQKKIQGSKDILTWCIIKGGKIMRTFATKYNDPQAMLGWNERIGYGAGQLGMNAINAVLGSFLTIYFTNAALLDAGIIATIIAVSKVFDGISDLIMGNIVDRTKSRFGKARVWMMRMCIPFAVTTVLLFTVPSNWPDMAKYVYVFIFYNLVNAVCYTAMLVPYYSMISLMTKNAYERGMLGNIQQIFQTLANVIINSVFIAMLTMFTDNAENIYTQRAFTITMIIISSAMVILSLICFFFTKERVKDEASSAENGGTQASKSSATNPVKAFKALITNRYWVVMFFAMFVIFFVIIMYSVGNVYYSQYVYNDMSRYPWMSNAISIAQFSIMFVTPFFMKKFGKANIYKLGIALMTLGFLGFGLFAHSLPTIILFNALKGIGLGMSGGMAMGMVADTITYSRLKSGIDPVGMGNAAMSASQKLGLGLGTAVLVIMCAIVLVALLVLYDIEKKLPQMEQEQKN